MIPIRTKEDCERVLLLKEQNYKKCLDMCNPEQKEMIELWVPKDQKYIFARAYTNNSRTDKIKAKCLDCSNYQKKEVELCETYGCPLYSIRPYQKKTSG